MLYSEQTKKALTLCFEVHKDQVDKAGIPYVFHPYHLAEQMSDELTTVVALLHDVIEDSDYTLADLAAMGFDAKVISALKLLTRDKQTPYMEYIRAIKKDAIARKVKLADLAHNCDITRLPTHSIDEKTIKRVKKYQQAIAFLKHEDDFALTDTRKE